MAKNTDISLQKQTIYSIYVRSHTPEGSFQAVIPDLDRIRELGADIIWLMPIHPIGEKGKKGSLGCPYSIRDYRAVNPAYGTIEDFQALADAVHARGMKLMIDVVYNHSSRDSVLLEQHPEFYWRDAVGNVGNKVGDWSDVLDLDYRVPALWDYQIETLKYWAEIVDGFRCDVASFVPVEFWKRARAEVETVRPGCIWLAETVHLRFGNRYRREGNYAARDSEAFEAFDVEYEYDVREAFDRYLRGETPLSTWMELLNYQEGVYPPNYNKLRFLENHDQPRIASRVTDEGELVNYTALLYFLKGTTLLYAGQEFENDHLPSLFEREPISRDTGRDLTPLLRTLADIKRGALGADDGFDAWADDENDIAVMERSNHEGRKFGIFSLKSKTAEIPVSAPDGDYLNLIDGSAVPVREGKTLCCGRPMIFII
ncbi:MAG: alpha-amylase [Oscillospiraceae bacterium]|nr:alpha-amylase [Oscillospiraceae bacterium]